MMPVLRPLRAFYRRRFEAFRPDVRRVLRVDIRAALLLTAFTGLTAPFTGLILRRELGATPFQLSIMSSASAVFMLLSLFWARSVRDRTPLPYVVWPGVIGRGLFLLVPLIHSSWAFIAVLVAVSLLGTVGAPASTALVERVYPHDQRGRALAMVRVTAAVPGIALALVAGTILAVADYRWVFAAAGLLGIAGSLRQREIPVPERPPMASAERSGLREAWRTLRRDRDFRRLLFAHFVFGSAIWLEMPANPLVLADVVRATTTQVGVFAAAGAVAALVANAGWGRFADRRSNLRALRLVYCLGVITALLYAVADSAWIMVLVAVSDAAMTTGLDLVWMLALIEVAGARRTAHYAAISATLAGVRGIVGPLVGAVVVEHVGIQAVYVVAASLMISAAWLVSREVHDAETQPVARFTRRLLNAIPGR